MGQQPLSDDPLLIYDPICCLHRSFIRRLQKQTLASVEEIASSAEVTDTKLHPGRQTQPAVTHDMRLVGRAAAGSHEHAAAMFTTLYNSGF